MNKQFTLITPRAVYRVAARTKEQIEQAAKDVGLVVLGIAEDRPPRKTSVAAAFTDASFVGAGLALS